MIDTNVTGMLHGSQCESVPFDQEFQGFHLSRSLVETCTRFLACMVDTQDYICQMRNTYVKELWPKVCAEMTESKTKVIGLEKDLADCQKEREESRRDYVQQFERLRMASEDERSSRIREVDSLQHHLRKEGQCELRVCSEPDSAGKLPNHAADFEFLRVELEEQKELLERRIEAYEKSNSELSTSNEELRQQLQVRTVEIEELTKTLELAGLKQQFREQQRSLQEDSEDRYKRERRLSLKKQWHSGISRSPPEPWKRERGVEIGSLTNLRPVDGPGMLQSVSNVQSNAADLNNCDITIPVVKSAASPPTHIKYLAPGAKGINLEAAATAQGKLPEDHIGPGQDTYEIVPGAKFEAHAKGRVTVGECTGNRSSKGAECNGEQGTLESEKHITGGASRVAEGEDKARSVPVSAHQAEIPATSVECPEPDSVENPKQPLTSISCNPAVIRDLAGNENSRLAVVGRLSGELAYLTPTKQCSPVDKGLQQPQRASVSETSKNVPEYRAGLRSHHSTGKNSKERKWRHTRSRTEVDREDLQDSFLSTPREVVLANLKSRAESKRIQQQEPLGELRHQHRNKWSSSTSLIVNKGERETDLVTPYEWTDDCELKDKQSVWSRASAEKSTRSTEGADNEEKSSRPSSGARTSTSDKERQAHSSRAPAYKFNEPIRKKRDREQLEATDCLQCRKFYDAVLAEDAEGVTMDRCEHHDAASRHRYKYLPPGTPAGFWNIGFDSEF